LLRLRPGLVLADRAAGVPASVLHGIGLLPEKQVKEAG